MNPLLRTARTLFAVIAWPITAVLDRVTGEPPVTFRTALDWAREPVRTGYVAREYAADHEDYGCCALDPDHDGPLEVHHLHGHRTLPGMQ